MAPTTLTINGSGVNAPGAGARRWRHRRSRDFTIGSDATIGVTNGSSTIGTGIGDGGNGYGVTVGGGTLALTATNTYTGTTTVTAGTLEVDGAILSSSGVTVDSGATLAGSGAVPAVTADSGAIVVPGSPSGPATLDTGDLELATGSQFQRCARRHVGRQLRSARRADGTVDLDSDTDGGAALNISFAPGYTPSGGDSFTIIANEGTDPDRRAPSSACRQARPSRSAAGPSGSPIPAGRITSLSS